jgi:hypothetical protein
VKVIISDDRLSSMSASSFISSCCSKGDEWKGNERSCLCIPESYISQPHTCVPHRYATTVTTAEIIGYESETKEPEWRIIQWNSLTFSRNCSISLLVYAPLTIPLIIALLSSVIFFSLALFPFHLHVFLQGIYPLMTGNRK